MIRPEAFEAQVEDTIRAIRRAEAAEAERDALKARVAELEAEIKRRFECGEDCENAREVDQLLLRERTLREALRGAVEAKDRELEGFRRTLGRYPLVMPRWLEPARAALQPAEGGER